jgi:hypothetical protein
MSVFNEGGVMKEIKVILPVAPSRVDADAARILHRNLKQSLIELFGGVTVSKAEGSWEDEDGLIIDEEVKVYVCAVDVEDNPIGFARHNAFIRVLGRAFRASFEEALYFVDFDGEAKIWSLCDMSQALNAIYNS